MYSPTHGRNHTEHPHTRTSHTGHPTHAPPTHEPPPPREHAHTHSLSRIKTVTSHPASLAGAGASVPNTLLGAASGPYFEGCGPRRQRSDMWLYLKLGEQGQIFSYHLYLPLGMCQPHMQPASLFLGCLLKKKLYTESVITWSSLLRPPPAPRPCPASLPTLPACSYPLSPREDPG